MRKKLFLKILIGIVAFILLLFILIKIIVEPAIEIKILSTLNQNNKGYIFQVEKINISFLPAGAELKNISITTRPVKGSTSNLKGKIASISIKGISLLMLLIKKDVSIREITISNSKIEGIMPFPKKKSVPVISTLNVSIGSIHINKLNLALKYDSTARTLSVKNGILKVRDIRFLNKDTLGFHMAEKMDFSAAEILSVSSDSMYSFKVSSVHYSTASRKMDAGSFEMHPNYTDYEFSSRHEFQTDRIEGMFNNIYFHGFSIEEYLKSGNLISTNIEIGKVEMNVFRDKREKFDHLKKPVFQDLIYNFPGNLSIDTISIKSGRITYAEHTLGASGQGRINFEEITAKVYNITNDSIYKKKKGYFELEAACLLMGKSRLSVSIKGKLFDKNNTFLMKGSLSAMEADALNPMLENAASLFATAGKIDAMDFNFTANNYKSSGQMTLLYHGLDIAVKNKKTDDTTAFKERVISIIANYKILDSNPLPRKEVRIGIIEHERDTERFLFNYCFKSILSGIKTTLIKNPQKKDKKS